MLRLNNVFKEYKLSKYNEQKVLKNINLEFRKGELVAIYGKSGSGKTTLLNLLGLLDKTSAGEIYLNNNKINDNRKLSDVFSSEYRRKEVGFIFQQYNIINHLSVLENVMLPLLIDNKNKEYAKKKSIELLKSVELEKHIKKMPNKLSGGELQRVAIARALANDPEIILADEPTGAIDSKNRKLVLSILRKIAEQNKLVIIVTHDDEVLNYATRVIKIRDGVIVNDNTKEKLVKSIKSKSYSTVYNKRIPFTNFLNALKFAINNIKNRKVRFTITAFAASISVVGGLLAYGIGIGADKYVTELSNKYDNPLILEFEKVRATFYNNEPRSDYTDEDYNLLYNDSRIRGVFESNKVYASFAYKKPNDDFYHTEPVELISIFPSKYEDVHDVSINELIYGRPPKDNTYEMLLSYEMAYRYMNLLEITEMNSLLNTNFLLQHFDYEIGEPYHTEFTIVGILSKDAIARNKDKKYNRHAFIPLDTLNNLIEIHPDYQDVDKSLRIVAVSITDASSLKREYGDPFLSNAIKMASIKAINDAIHVIKPSKYIFIGLVSITAFIAVIMISILLHINVVDRIKEIGILKSIGASKKDIKKIFYIEAVLLGLSMSIIATISVILLKNILNEIIIDIINWKLDFTPIKLYPSSYLISIILSVAIAIISSLYAVNYAANVDPVKALKK